MYNTKYCLFIEIEKLKFYNFFYLVKIVYPCLQIDAKGMFDSCPNLVKLYYDVYKQLVCQYVYLPRLTNWNRNLFFYTFVDFLNDKIFFLLYQR